MLGLEGYVDIQVMCRQGRSIKAISRELGVSRNTVRRYARAASVPEPKVRARKVSKLDAYRDYLRARVDSAAPDWIPATVLFDEISALGYDGCVRTVRSYVAMLKPERKEDPVVRFETAPGQQMQVDWAAFKLGGQRISLFLATLGWSRHGFGVFVENERFETLKQCHEEAFVAFGGVPREVLYDNMRTVVLERNGYGQGIHRFHPGLNDLAHHYGFLPRLCRPYRAKTKGKVERAIGYVRRSFFVPLVSRYRQLGEPLDLNGLNLEFARWLALSANARNHGTTRARPDKRLERERLFLQPLPPASMSGTEPLYGASTHCHTDFTVESLQHPLSVYEALLEGSA